MEKSTRILVLSLLLFFFSIALVFARPQTLVRAEIDDQYKWDLTPVYADWDAWEEAVTLLKQRTEAFRAYEGTLSEGPARLAEALRARADLWMLANRVHAYAFLKSVEDTREQTAQANFQRASMLQSEIAQSSAWFTPELLTIDEATMNGWIEKTPELAEFRFPISELYRTREHTLSPDKEALLAGAGPIVGSADALYEMMSTADIAFPSVTLADGREVVATHGNYGYIQRTSRVQEDRRKIMQAHYKWYNEHTNSYAALANLSMQGDWFQAKARGYDSCLEMALDGSGIPVDVYLSLVKTAREGAAPLHRYQQLRRRALGLDSYAYYDSYLPLAESMEEFSFERSRDLILEAVQVLGGEYAGRVKRAFDERWIDVYENEGKQSGAFSQGIYDVHPYVKLNHSDTMYDMFTLAHELGHAMHSVYASGNQPWATAAYETFVAEVASTMGEHVLMDLMLERIDDPETRIALIEMRIGNIVGTFYRQTMFADYELRAHELVEQGKPVTAETLGDLYMDVYTDFFGDTHDEMEAYRNTWAFIPHFYTLPPFYVFQYATSESASAKLHHDMIHGSKKERKAARERFLTLISSGAADNPVTLLQNAGVDMSTTEPYEALIAEMDGLVTRLEKELKAAGRLKS